MPQLSRVSPSPGDLLASDLRRQGSYSLWKHKEGGDETGFVVSSFGKREAEQGAAGQSECGSDTCGSRLGTAGAAVRLECCRDVGTFPVVTSNVSLACVCKVFTEPVTLAVRLL